MLKPHYPGYGARAEMKRLDAVQWPPEWHHWSPGNARDWQEANGVGLTRSGEKSHSTR
ncbi:hypothetical protein J2W83_002449 [Pseudomonas hunanensis]|uniref:Uncharacterized protein n=1 Tax=Pseudomonas hunanensis TaxID=1247546 RepID=A0ACC6K379_9PSED|nr:hypothetical protein [Pseudomonas hunanensis]MDR6712847.1 hypothetical protein [Pseudomonas hunanensis]